jgi:predicted DNA-binding transcriptional regulator YafY
MSKAANGLILMDYLSSGRKTRKQIAVRLNISERSVMRLIEELNSDEFKIIKGRNGGYEISTESTLKNICITSEEILILKEAISAYKTTVDDKITASILSKIKETFPNEKEWLLVDFSRWDSSGFMDDIYVRIKRAILASQKIRFEYHDMYNKKTERVIAPCWLVFKEHSWYVKGYCYLRKSMRTFKLSKMRKIVFLLEKFDIDKKLKQDKEIYYNNNFKIVELTLKVKKELEAKVYEDFNEQFVQKNDIDGTLIIKCRIHKDDRFIPLILSYGENATVISPQEVYDEISSIIQKMYANIQENS